MPLRRLFHLMLAVTGCLAASCSTFVGPPNDPGDEPPEVHGPGRIAGSLEITAPALWIEDRTTPEPARVGGTVGVYTQGRLQPVRWVRPEYVQVDPENPHLWRGEYDFGDLPLGQYQVRLAHLEYPDWGIVNYTELFAGTSVTLTEAQPEAMGLHDAMIDQSYGESGEISGQLLLDGIQFYEVTVALNREPTEYGLEVDDRSVVSWNAAVTPHADHGLVDYRVTGLKFRSHYFEGLALVKDGEWVPDSAVVLSEAVPEITGHDLLTSAHIPVAHAIELGVDVEGDYDGTLMVEARLSDETAVARWFVLRDDGTHWSIPRWQAAFPKVAPYELFVYRLESGGAATLVQGNIPVEWITTVVEQTDPPSLFIEPGTFYHARANIALSFPE